MNVLSSDIRLHVERMQTTLKEEGIDAFIGASSVATLYFFGQVLNHSENIKDCMISVKESS